MTVLVNILGIAAIAFIVWWFWLWTPKAVGRVAGQQTIDIVVDGGVYSPARIETALGQTLTLRFLRNDPTPCAEKVIFDGLDISGDLPLGQPREIEVTPTSPGEYEFTCQMGMYRGKLVVS